MELWIRSQDRECLMKVDRVDYDISREHRIVANGFQTLLGTYKTKERALEVLDEIQGRITSNECLITMMPMANNIKGYEEKFGKLFKETIYEMPIE